MAEISNDRGPAENRGCNDISESSPRCMTMIGNGELGGKARGLVSLERILASGIDSSSLPGITVDIPWFWAITTDWFDRFMEENRLYDIALSDARDQHIANSFLRAELPGELVTELKHLIADVTVPLAIRSSSLLEDSLSEPFAGVYETKMVPNNQFSANARLRTLTEAIKFVYASTFSNSAKSYRRAMGREDRDEKMAVLVQEVIGARHADRFYPNISGVARSYNFYALGNARPEDGVANLALGLGKTIVDGGRSWTYCPALPKAKPPYGSVKELLTQTQTLFWAVNMGKPPFCDPIQETEYLIKGHLGNAEEDGVLSEIASTYDAASDRIVMGIGSPGARILNFSPLLGMRDIPLNDLIKQLMSICEHALGNPVEIEFAAAIDRPGGRGVRFGFLQVRPMFVSHDRIDVSEEEMNGPDILISSDQVLGNGRIDTIRDIVYVKPEAFSAKDTWMVATELDEMNRRLLDTGRSYLLMVIGRLGTSDPWLGIPVQWGQVSGAKVVVETTTVDMNVDMSQGSHLFHNMTCLRILYFSTDKTGRYPECWEWLKEQHIAHDLHFVRHVTLESPLHVKVDGRNSRGVVRHGR